MAAWLRFGRLGSFKVDSCSTLIRHPVTRLCSEAKEPGQAIKNLKGPHNREDERAAVRACKTAVAFPVKSSGPGILAPCLAVPTKPISSTSTSEIAAAAVTVASKSVGAKSESLAVPVSLYPSENQEEGTQIIADDAPPVFPQMQKPQLRQVVKSSPPIDFPATIGDVVQAAMVSCKHGDSAVEELSSSSSSDSDTDSDYECNREDKKLEVEPIARSPSSVLYSPSHQEKAQDKEHLVNGVNKGITIAETEAPQCIVEASKDNSQDSGSKILAATKGAAELASSNFLINAAPGITQHNAQNELPALVVTQNESPEKAQSNGPVKTVDGFTAPADGLGDAAEESWEKATVGPVESESVSATVAANPPAEGGSSADRVEELVDSAQVVMEATGEELHAETTAAQPEESAAAPPETEEPFDNSTYKITSTTAIPTTPLQTWM